jgi:hypothetical protein
LIHGATPALCVHAAHLKASQKLLLLNASVLWSEGRTGEGAAAPGRQCRPTMQAGLEAVQGGLRHALTMPPYRPRGTPTTRAIRLAGPMLLGSVAVGWGAGTGQIGATMH